MIRRERLAGRIKGSAIILWSQVALIALWMISFDKFEYASLDYLFCGVVGLFCLWKNQGIIRGGGIVLSLAFSLSVVLSNYDRFVPTHNIYSIVQMGISAPGGFLVCGHILSWAMNRQASYADEGRKTPVRVFLLSMAGILAVYWMYLFSSAFPGLSLIHI